MVWKMLVPCWEQLLSIHWRHFGKQYRTAQQRRSMQSPSLWKKLGLLGLSFDNIVICFSNWKQGWEFKWKHQYWWKEDRQTVRPWANKFNNQQTERTLATELVKYWQEISFVCYRNKATDKEKLKLASDYKLFTSRLSANEKQLVGWFLGQVISGQ